MRWNAYEQYAVCLLENILLILGFLLKTWPDLSLIHDPINRSKCACDSWLLTSDVYIISLVRNKWIKSPCLRYSSPSYLKLLKVKHLHWPISQEATLSSASVQPISTIYGDSSRITTCTKPSYRLNCTLVLILDQLQTMILRPAEMVVFFLVHSPEFLLTGMGFSLHMAQRSKHLMFCGKKYRQDVKALESNRLLICLEPSQTVIVV